MFLCDCHCDTITELYKQNKHLWSNDLMLDAKRIIANGGGLQFIAMYVPTEEFRWGGGTRYTLKLVDKYLTETKAIRDQGIDIHKILTKDDVDHALEHPFNTLLAIEEGGALDGSLEALRVYYEGLTQFGRQVVAEMNRIGMAVDVSHISTYGFWDVLDTSQKPVIATHSCAYALTDHPRNLRDDQLRALAKTKGFVGVNFAGQFLEKDYHDACIESVYKHLAYMMDVMGSDDYVGFGSDFDGISHPPYNLNRVEHLADLFDYLAGKFPAATLDKIAHDNCFAYLKRVL